MFDFLTSLYSHESLDLSGLRGSDLAEENALHSDPDAGHGLMVVKDGRVGKGVDRLVDKHNFDRQTNQGQVS